jgi:hypothetical protein
LSLALARALSTVGSQRLACYLAKDPPVLARFGWSSLISQAGLTLGLSVLVERAFPQFGPSFRSLAIATVAINEVLGPVLFKFALDRALETGKAAHKGEAVGIESESTPAIPASGVLLKTR